MIDPNGRYADIRQAELEGPDGRTRRHVVPPILPHPEDYTPARVHLVSDSDRADIIAAQTYGQATAWWMLANANTAAHPDQLTDTPGTSRVIPMLDTTRGEND